MTEKKEAVHGPRDLKSWVQLALRGSRRSGCGQEPGTRVVAEDAPGRSISSLPGEGAAHRR